jgi:two-component system nitrate/nitrite response regulator NarL
MAVLIVDDHPLFREGLRQVLQGLPNSKEVIAEGDAARALELAATRTDLELVLIDLSMPGMDGFTALARFARDAPGLPVVVVSANEDAAEVRRALALGAVGYIPKSTPPNQLLDALRLVMGGGMYVPSLLLRAAQPRAAPQASRGAAADEDSASDQSLTDRQLAVLALLSQGKSNKLIARELDLAEKTVKAHVTAVFRTLGVVNRTQAALEARRLGLVK